MFLRVTLSIVFALILAVAPAPNARATTVLKVDVNAMTRISDWIVRATVVSTTPVDLRPEGGTLYTDVQLKIQTVYQGKNVPSLATIRLMGGVGADGLAVTVPGMPQFRTGEQVVIFLEKTKHGFVPCGLEQGVYQVRQVGAVSYVDRRSRGAHLVERSQQGHLVAAHPPAVTPATTLAELETSIRSAQTALRAPVPSTPPPANPLTR